LVQHDRKRRFELLALPHLDAAFNLARWLAGNTADAEDVVQDAYLRAFRYFDAWQGGNFRVWLLTIVRNSFFTWAKENRSSRLVFHPEAPTGDTAEAETTAWGTPPRDPEALLMERIDSQTLARLMERLPTEYREVLLLREVEDLAYKEIAEVCGVPIGTVMSRLARARLALRKLVRCRGAGGGRCSVIAHGACCRR
jgi:RNA polymerase sigma-70 factor (ECF subfamily)